MSSLYIKVEVSPGTEINRACEDAVALARRMRIGVDFSFNGITCLAHHDTHPGELSSAWHKAIKSDSKHKIAVAAARQKPKDERPIRFPLGMWDLKGNWYPNPNLDMSPEEQRAHNIRHGFLNPEGQ